MPPSPIDRRWHAGGTLLIGVPGPQLDRETAERVATLAPAGVILFRRNLSSPEQTRRLLDELRTLLPPDPILAVDQEGGRVSRLEPFVGPTPSAAMLARAGVSATQRFARATGQALRSLGFNLDFAPVVDLCAPDAPNGIGARSFGVDPESVTRLAAAYLAGLAEAQIAGCLKHFPGLGATVVDSHLVRPRVEKSRAELEATELVPFRRLAPVTPAVMIGHGHYPALDPASEAPASLSSRIVASLLRTEIAFDGLVVTDDLEMGAVGELDVDGSAAVAAIEAGCDLLLYCAELDRAERAARAIFDRAHGQPTFARRLDEALQSIRRFRACWAGQHQQPPDWSTARLALERASAEGQADGGAIV